MSSSNAVPPAPVLSVHGSECHEQYNNFTVLWNVTKSLLNQVIVSPFPSSQISHPLPPPAYEPVEAVWVNYTVENDCIHTTSEISSGPLPPSTESFVIENATLGATYTITVSALNQLGWNSTNITVPCKG